MMMVSKLRMKIEQGFTLLEVMIALAVFAISAMAISQATIQNNDTTGYLKEKMYASWVAQNSMATLLLKTPWPATYSGKEDTMELAQIEWLIKTDITNMDINELKLLGIELRKIEIGVYHKGAPEFRVATLERVVTAP